MISSVEVLSTMQWAVNRRKTVATFPVPKNSHSTDDQLPSLEDWDEEKAFDPTIRSRAYTGVVKTRPMCNRVPRKFTVVYPAVRISEKNTIAAFEDQIMVGSTIFQYSNPDENVSYDVRLLDPINYKKIAHKWRIEMHLEEV